MERLPLFCQENRLGEITLALCGPNGTRREIHAVMPDPGDGLYRAFLLGEAGELPLGVMAPEGGCLATCRRVYFRDVDQLGQLLRGEARKSFPFQNKSELWQETRCPAQLFHDHFLSDRLRSVCFAWWRRDGDLLLLALPLERGRPFPLDALFCLGSVRCVMGRKCVVYAFRNDAPVLPDLKNF